MAIEGPPIEGRCDARFAAVREVLRQNFVGHGEVGAAVAVAIDGRLVVDLWAGWADRERTRPWEADTLVDVFSVGKAMTTIALLRLVESGRVDLDAPVARYWPEFARSGKEDVRVRTVLAHRAGLPGIRDSLPPGSMYDWTAMTRALAAETPWWEPDRHHGYHVNTFGFLVGEMVRRVAGQTIGALFAAEVAAPLGADFHFGIGVDLEARVAEHLLPTDDSMLPELLLAGERTDPADPLERLAFLRGVYVNPPGISGFGTVNTTAWRRAEMPSTNGHASARAVARVYSALACGGAVDGVRILRRETIDEAAREASVGPDIVLSRNSRFGLGFQLTRPESPFGTGPRSFGHFGAGGSVGFADPDARLAFAYVMNQPGPRWNNPRNRGLIDAVYASL